MPGADTKDYRDLYFDERFDRVDDKFKGMNEKLDTIIRNQEIFVNNVESLEKRIKVVEEKQLLCPINAVHKELEHVKQDIEDISYYKKRPAQIKVLALGLVFMFIIYLIPIIEKFITWFKS